MACELNGVQAAGKCACYEGWQGSTCGTLDLLPGTVIWPANHPSERGSQDWWD